MGDIRLTVRIDFGSDRALGPGKIRLLEAIGRTGSISQGGRALEMSYRRAWLLVDDLKPAFANRWSPRNRAGRKAAALRSHRSVRR